MECPECDGPVTVEVGRGQPLSTSILDTLLDADEDEDLIILRDCWACGWDEERSVVIESIETTPGDTDAIERTELLNEIMREASKIDSTATLEDAFAELRRKRRLETGVANSSNNVDGG